LEAATNRIEAVRAEAENRIEMMRAEAEREHQRLERLVEELSGRNLEGVRLSRLNELQRTMRTALERAFDETMARARSQVPQAGTWQWQGPDGTFIDYDPEVSMQIEAHVAQHAEGFAPPIDVVNVGLAVRVYPASLEQHLVANTGRRRPIRWSSTGAQEPSWTPQSPSEPAVLVNVERGTSDFSKVAQIMFGDGPGSLQQSFMMVSVSRVQNRYLMNLYTAERQNTILRRGPGGLNEQMLVHGTGRSIPHTVATSKEGFMVEYSRTGFYGKGLYFAVQPGYSHSRAHRTVEDGITLYHMLICRVICGRPRQFGGQIARDFTRLNLPPEDFDCVEGGPHQPTQQGPGPDASMMYVVYQGAQVYPDFLVTYRELRTDERPVQIPIEAS